MLDQLARPGQRTQSPTGRVECRVYERHSCELASSCHPATGVGAAEQKWAATIRRLSQGGVCLVLGRRYERGAGLAIELPGTEGQERSTVFARVVYTKALENGLWSLGCQFISPLGEDELQRLCKKRQPAPSTIDVRLQLINGHDPFLNCVFKRFRTPKSWPLPVGQTITLRGNASDNGSWSLKVQVVACQKQDDRWTLRCRLINRPSAAKILQALATPDL